MKTDIVETRPRRIFHTRPGVTCLEPTLTQQHYQEQVLASNIVKRWKRDGGPGPGEAPPPNPSYGDFTNLVDYAEAVTRIRRADAAFLALPSMVRAACENDPGKFLELVKTTEGRKLLVDQGLKASSTPSWLEESGANDPAPAGSGAAGGPEGENPPEPAEEPAP